MQPHTYKETSLMPYTSRTPRTGCHSTGCCADCHLLHSLLMHRLCCPSHSVWQPKGYSATYPTLSQMTSLCNDRLKHL